MKNINARTMKYLMLVIFVCLFFILAVQNAYKYLPENSNVQELKKIVEEPQSYNRESEEKNDEVVEENIEEPALDEVDEVFDDNEKFKEIDKLNDENRTREIGSMDDRFKKVSEFKKNKEYTLAIAELESILRETSDDEIQAECYYEIAYINGILKRYGTALSNAQKAFNKSPSTQREMLLARLYNKVGQTDKAKERINNILTREFIED